MKIDLLLTVFSLPLLCDNVNLKFFWKVYIGKVFRLKFLHVNYLSADKSNNRLLIKQRQKLELAYDCFRTVTKTNLQYS